MTSYQTPQLTCQSCIQLSSTLCKWEVVLNMEVKDLMDTGNQQAVGPYSQNHNGQQC